MGSRRLHLRQVHTAVAKLPLFPLTSASIFSVLLTILDPGCGGGGSGGGSRPSPLASEQNGVAQDVIQRDLGNGRIEVQFTLLIPSAKQVGVEIERSENRGLDYSEATLEAPAKRNAPSSLPASPTGVRHSLIWLIDRDIEDRNQHDLRIRVSPYNVVTKAPGISAESAVFGFGSNSAPRITSISTPDGVQGGWVKFTYTASDADGDYMGIEGEYSLDGGGTYRAATLGQGDGVEGLAAPPEGTVHSISWNAQGDAPGQAIEGVRIRLRAVDTDPGLPIESGGFSIDTRGPSISLLTIDAIPPEMNGSAAFTDTSGESRSFTLLAPESGFVIWVTFTCGGSAIDPEGLEMTSVNPLGGGASEGGIDAGQSFGGRFQVNAGSGRATLTVGSDLRFPAAIHTITASISDALGNNSDPVSYTFETAPATAANLPFENADRWYIDFSRDNFAITSNTNGHGTVKITAKAGGNGIPDFIEDLRILGLQSASSPVPGLDALVLQSVKEAILGRLNEHYGRSFHGSQGPDGVSILFTSDPPAGKHSTIAIGGDDPLPGYTLGRAEFDLKNSTENDDSSADLGVFLTNLIEYYINSSSSFRSRFNPLIPGRGSPLGFHPLDSTVLSESFDRSDPGNTYEENQRYDQIELAIDAISRSAATILAHEIGHSVGLVANYAPPEGLFGGESLASFAGPYTNSFHLDAGDNDIMAAALSFSESIQSGNSGPRFNSLSFAYLLERILLK